MTMSTPTIPDGPPQVQDAGTYADPRITARLDQLEKEVDRGNREGRRAGRSFSIFALMALGIALANLIVVAAKLDGSSSSTSPAPSARSAPAVAPAPALVHRVATTLREYTVAPSSTVGAAGRVTFAVRNAGTVPHEFVVLRTPKPASGLLKGNEADETGNVGEIGDLQPGQTKTLTLPLKPGHYALICNLPGHYKAGQHADFTVR
jgi:uncharacterized cupredoxin-like copper-binding protein